MHKHAELCCCGIHPPLDPLFFCYFVCTCLQGMSCLLTSPLPCTEYAAALHCTVLCCAMLPGPAGPVVSAC